MTKFNFKKNLAANLQNRYFSYCNLNAATLKANGTSERGLLHKLAFFKAGGNSGEVKFFGTKEIQVHYAGIQVYCKYVAVPTEATVREILAALPR